MAPFAPNEAPSGLIDERDIKILKQVGVGAHGCVWKATLQGELVAVKITTDRGDHSQDAERARKRSQREIEILRQLIHPNIVEYKGSAIINGRLAFVTEYIEGGNLLEANSNGDIRWDPRALDILLGIACALDHVHQHNIVHLDLKSPNCLYDLQPSKGQPTVKVCDFGIAREITGTFLDTSTDSLSLAWAAPEQRMHNLIPREADIYAFGVMHALAVCKVAGAMQVIMWELVTGEIPPRWGGRRPVRVPEEASQAMADVINACTDPEWEKRPAAASILGSLNKLKGEQSTYGTCKRSQPQNPPARARRRDHDKAESSLLELRMSSGVYLSPFGASTHSGSQNRVQSSHPQADELPELPEPPELPAEVQTARPAGPSGSKDVNLRIIQISSAVQLLTIVFVKKLDQLPALLALPIYIAFLVSAVIMTFAILYRPLPCLGRSLRGRIAADPGLVVIKVCIIFYLGTYPLVALMGSILGDRAKAPGLVIVLLGIWATFLAMGIAVWKQLLSWYRMLDPAPVPELPDEEVPLQSSELRRREIV